MNEEEVKDQIANTATRNERLAWNRKMVKMEKLVDELRPIEERILEIIATEKYPLMDKIEAVRKVMVNECVHPVEFLEVDPNYTHAHCKFCGKNIQWQ